MNKRKIIVAKMVFAAIEMGGYVGVSREQIINYTVQIGAACSVTEAEVAEALDAPLNQYLELK